MPSFVVAEQVINVGSKVVIEAPSPSSPYTVIFEDDGETGYFYALDPLKKEQPVQDVLHIYDLGSVRDRKKPSIAQIAWTEDGTKVVLLINRYPHAVFNFSDKRGYCRPAFPPPHGECSKEGHGWDDSVKELFR